MKTIEICFKCHKLFDGIEFATIEEYFAHQRTHEIVFCRDCADEIKQTIPSKIKIEKLNNSI